MVLLLVLIVFVVFALVALVEFERFGWSTILLIGSLVAAQYFLVDIVGWVRVNYFLLLSSVGVYLVLGIVWSFIKWFLFLLQFKMRRQEALNTGYRLSDCNYKGTGLHKTPKAYNYKGNIIAWGSLWPISVIGTLINDPVRKFMNLVYNYLSSLYQKIADKIVPDLTDQEDLKSKTPLFKENEEIKSNRPSFKRFP